jgi:hypothetical protein
MNERITIRLPKELYHRLKDESAKQGIGASVLVRQWLENYLLDSAEKLPNETGEKSSDCKIQDEIKTLHPLIQENNLLLRKIARYTNSQIVIETDEQLKHLRKKAGP